MSLLIINMTDSKCGECGISCDPYEKTHETNLGWSSETRAKPGCGARYTHVSSDYVMEGLHRTIKQMRPDLDWIDPLDRSWKSKDFVREVDKRRQT